MQKNLKTSIQNCLLSFYPNGQLYPCRLSFYLDNMLKIQKIYTSNIETYPKNVVSISQNSINFCLKIHINLNFAISIRKMNLSTLGVRVIQVVILNNQTTQTFRVYAPKTVQNYQKLYECFRKICFQQNFEHFFQIYQIFKCTSSNHQTHYFIVNEKTTLKNKMAKRYSKHDLNPSTERRIKKEIEIQNKLNCPLIIGFEGIFQDNQFIYLVYDAIPNKNLKEFTKQFKESQRSHVKTILKQLLEAALELQINNIVHNNIQPSTVQLINESLNWKICMNHFSDAILLSEWNPEAQSQMSKYYGYSAPEVLNPTKGKLSSKSDVFSIGAVFYYALFGKHLIRLPAERSFLFVDSYPEIDFETQEMKFLPFESTVFDISALQLLKRMLQFNPDKRISIIEALTHRFFTTRSHSGRKSALRQSTKKSPTKNSNRKQTSMLRTHQPNSSGFGLKENTNLMKETVNNRREGGEAKLRFLHIDKEKKSSFKKEEDGEIDSQEIDDSHINLEPRNSGTMAPSYDGKKNNEFKFYTW